MAKKPPPESSEPSKAYLVSFGDTMTALLAFFIVLNSLAKEQTGANMYAGTGSFVNAFTNSGMPGGLPSNRSDEMLQQTAQKPIYALAENLDSNQSKNVGPDDTHKKEKVKNRDNEQFQKFLTDIEKKFGLENHAPLFNQTVFDSFERLDPKTGGISRHVIQLLSESTAKLRRPEVNIEVIVWATVPSKKNLDQHLSKMDAIQAEVERLFWLTPTEKKRIRYRVKPWLFSDAKRPIISIVVAESEASGSGDVSSDLPLVTEG